MQVLPNILLIFSILLNSSYASVSTTRVATALQCPDISEVAPNGTCADRASCVGNSPSNRLEWCCHDTFTVFSDYESDNIPNTGVTREYWFEISQHLLEPDGYPRWTLAVNGSIPGPTIQADWGDWVVIHVLNNITDRVRIEARGVTLHWHGISQKGTNLDDGVPSITQCPIAPGHSMTYRWRATQYGTAWYHAHMGLQAWDGVFGGIVINGPAISNYDEDKGVLFLNDWTHMTIEDAYDVVQIWTPQVVSNGLLNGLNVWSPAKDASLCPHLGPVINITCQLKRDESPPPTATTSGSRYFTEMEPGKSYRIRLINAAVDNNFEFLIEGHNLTVIAVDMVPICPYVTHSVNIFMGQRYDVIVTAKNPSSGPFWIQSIPLNGCSQIYNPAGIKGVLHYGAKTTTTPKDLETNVPNLCIEEPLNKLVPVVRKTVPSLPANTPFRSESSNCTSCESALLINVTINSPQADGNSPAMFRWRLNGQDMRSPWSVPSVMSANSSNTNLINMFETPREHEWTYALIISSGNAPTDHPIHLHGHDFYILAQGKGLWNGGKATWNDSLANLNNPPRRDTAMLYAGLSYLLLAWKADNPGFWLMHCHLGWHTSMGFDWQFLEKRQDLAKMDTRTLNETCDAWHKHSSRFGVWQSESWDQAGV